MNRFSAPHDCAPRDCASLAPFLTELFDGEADAQSAARARAHLLSCQECARLWLDWNSQRNILRNDNVPAPPPTLLWRVLVACRVSAQHQPASRRARALPGVSLHQWEAPIPTDLRAHILARTTRARRDGRLARAHRAALCAPVVLSPVAATASRRFGFRHFSLVGAPALALFVLLLGRASFEPASTLTLVPTSDRATAPAATQQRVSAPAPVAGASAPEAAPILAPARGEVELAAARPNFIRAPREMPSRAETVASRRVSPVAAPRLQNVAAANDGASRASGNFDQMITVAFDTARQTDFRVRVAAPEAGERGFESSRAAFQPRHIAPNAPAAKVRSRAAIKLAALGTGARVQTRATARARAASFSETPGAPRSRVALSDLTARPARGAADDNQNLRVSRPQGVGPVVRLASLNTGEGSGPHLDELHSAVDDFRAAISDSPGEGWDG